MRVSTPASQGGVAPDESAADRAAVYFAGIALAMVVLAIVILVIGLTFVSFKAVGQTLMSIGGFGLIFVSVNPVQWWMFGQPQPVLQPSRVPPAQLPGYTPGYSPSGYSFPGYSAVLVYGPFIFLGILLLSVMCLAVGFMINWRWSAVSQPAPLRTPVMTTVTPEKTVIVAPCRSIVARIAPSDPGLRRFVVSSSCPNSTAIRPQAVIPIGIGFGVQEVRLAFSSSPGDIRVELRDLPRGAFFEAQYGEALSRQPFAQTESLVWEIHDSNDVAFSFVKPKWLPFKIILDPFLGLRSLGELILVCVTLFLAVSGGILWKWFSDLAVKRLPGQAEQKAPS
jgi:hypothetical protein